VDTETPDPTPTPAPLAERAAALRREVVKPTLDNLAELTGLALNGDAAEELLLGTALHESGGLMYRRQLGGGPALGLYQMEPRTHDDIWKNFLAYHPKLADVLRQIYTPAGAELDATRLEVDDDYATAMARVFYWRVPAALPAAGDLAGQARYWKQYYNTPLGRGTVARYVQDWERAFVA
jgi:hypothetical protein